MTSTPRAGLQGRRILVVEDEYMIAAEMAHTLSSAGAETIGPVATVGDAERLIATEVSIDGALLDVNLGGEPVWPVVDLLMTRSIPMLLVTGYDITAIPKAYARLHACEKPISGSDLVRVFARVMMEVPCR